MPSMKAASLPGFRPIHWSADLAVWVRTGSITMTRPPRARRSRIAPITSRWEKMLPFDAAGLPPKMTNKSV